MGKIIICGDTHGNWKYLNELINKKKPEIILQCGDFGYWPGFEVKDIGLYNTEHIKYNTYKLCGIKNNNTKIYWCDGNHEDFSSLKKIKNNEICPNVFYMKRGSTLTLPNGKVVLFIGGADSIDKNCRTPGYDWFPDELISQKDIYNLPDIKVDIIISHTCPLEFDIKSGNCEKYKDPSRNALSYVLNRYRPYQWFFGHWHKYESGRYGRTQWFCLNMSNQTNWWKILEFDNTNDE